MMLYYDAEYKAPIIAKVIEISRNKNVNVVRKERYSSVSGVIDTDYYVYVRGDQDYSIRINWCTFGNGSDSGFIKFNYKCPDMASFPDMPEMVYRNLDDTTPAIGIDLKDSRIAELVRVLEYKSTVIKINSVVRKITGWFQNLLVDDKKR